VVDPAQREAILKRALSYPYATPERSYLYREGGAMELPEDFDRSGRTALLAYGANAAPEALALKLAALPGEPMPVERSRLHGFDVVYSAHVSPYGAVPATLLESPGTVAPVFVLFPTAEQHALLTTAASSSTARRWRWRRFAQRVAPCRSWTSQRCSSASAGNWPPSWSWRSSFTPASSAAGSSRFRD